MADKSNLDEVKKTLQGFWGKVFSKLWFLNAQKKYALRADRIQRLSHELRTSLTSIVGYSEFIESKTVEPVLGFTSKIIKESSSDLVRIFQSFYDLMKLDAGEVELVLSDVSLFEAIRDVIRGHQIRASEWNVQLTLTRTPDMDFLKIQTDFIRFQQMLEIMTFNMIKLAAPGSTVQLHVDYDEKAGFVNLSFLEFGAGEDHPDLNYLEKFWRGKESIPVHAQQGPGIDLVLAKALLIFLKGKATYRFVPSVGVNFRVILPLKRR